MYVCISLYRWRLFRRPIVSQPDRVVTYIKAAIALHNYLRTTESSVYCPPGFTDGEDGERNVIGGQMMSSLPEWDMWHARVVIGMLLPARTSEQGNVIGSVRIYVYKKKL